jgi:hypothetical protein
MFTISLLMSLTQLPTILPTRLVEVNSSNYMQPRLQSGQHKIIQRHCFCISSFHVCAQQLSILPAIEPVHVLGAVLVLDEFYY